MRPLRIFIAEDETIILGTFKMMVERAGHTVIGTALDGMQAEEQIRSLLPDMVLIDINMPKKTGLEVIKSINQDRLVPCIFITGYYSEQLSQQAAELGAFGYLLKPVDGKQLEATIQIAQARYEEFQQVYAQADSLRNALEERKYIERAKGILMDRFGLKEPDAMRQLQKKSKDKNKKLVIIAKEIIAAEKLLDV